MTRTAMQCLGAATRIESLAQELYSGLATTFQHQPYLRELFTQLAAEEGQHAMRIRLLERHQGKAPWPQETIDRVSADLDAVQEQMTAMKESFRMLSLVADARPVLRHLAEELARSSEPEIQKLFGSLAQQDSRHRELIQKALERNAA